jgi:plastocyanin
MRRIQAVFIAMVLAGLAACSSAYGPSGGGGGGGGGDGSPVGSVKVGPNIAFVSRHTGKIPAIDTIAVGATVTWTWTGGLAHSVRSIGTPAFASSSTMTGAGTYSVQFNTAGTYRYDCIVHGNAMSGTVVVLP